VLQEEGQSGEAGLSWGVREREDVKRETIHEFVFCKTHNHLVHLAAPCLFPTLIFFV
jgi:hypothetical protein